MRVLKSGIVSGLALALLAACGQQALTNAPQQTSPSQAGASGFQTKYLFNSYNSLGLGYYSSLYSSLYYPFATGAYSLAASAIAPYSLGAYGSIFPIGAYGLGCGYGGLGYGGLGYGFGRLGASSIYGGYYPFAAGLGYGSLYRGAYSPFIW